MKKKQAKSRKAQKSDAKKELQLSHKLQLEKNQHNYRSALKYRLKKSPLLLRVLKILSKIVGVFVLLSFLFLITLFLVFGRDLPDVRKLKDTDFRQTTHILDRNGQTLYQIFARETSENRQQIQLKQIDPKVIQATLAIEDKNYYRHFGFDILGIIRAQLKNIQEDNIAQGASTITQQLARNIFLSPERTYERKIKELLLALELEWYYSKDEILEMYFNKIAYGSNAFGIEAAAQTFFGTSAQKLSLVQASVLASLPKAPSHLSPYGHQKELLGYCKVAECLSAEDPNYVWGRKDYVLQRMLDDGDISKEERQAAWLESFQLTFKPYVNVIKNPHFVFYVKDFLEKRYGKELVENGGLQVTTSLDPKLQAIAEKAVADHVEKNKRYGANNASLIALDPKTGQVLAMVGSRDYWDPAIDGQVNVVLSPRQPGSSFKPLVYGAAIQNAGIGSGTMIADYKTLFNKRDIPQDYDGAYLGPMTVREALAGSRNIPAIKAYYIAGEEEKVLDFADKLGVKSLREFRDEFNKDNQHGWTFLYGWPMAIGSGEVPLLEMAGAYGVYANQGKFAPPNPILEIRDNKGNLLEKFDNPDPGLQVIDPQVAYIISNMLSDVWARPAGSWRNLLTIPGQNVAAKTGTSNKKVGGVELPNNDLTIGYTPSLVLGVWVGNTNGSPMRSNAYSLYTSDPIFHQFWVEALKDRVREEFPQPEGLKWLGKEVYPAWGGPKSFEKMFKRVDEMPDIPLSDFLKHTPKEVELYEKAKQEKEKLERIQ